MTVILLILKIVGILLLSLMGIVLFLLALVLFVPIRYQISGEIEETVKLQGKIHWLLHIVSFSFSYEGETSDYGLRIFGFRVGFGKKKASALDEEDFSEEEITSEAAEKGASEPLVLADKEEESDVTKQTEKTDTRIFKKQKVQRNSSSIWQRIRRFLQRIQQKVKRLFHAVRQLPQKITDIKTLFTDETSKKSVSLLFAELKYLLRHSRFRKIKTRLLFSLGDPATTGQILGILCMIPMLYQYEINIYPDFEAEKPYIKGSYFIKGYVRLVHGLISFVRLWKEKEFRKFVKTILKKIER